MDGELNYAKLLPMRPPDGVIPYLQKQGKLLTHYLVFRQDYVRDPLTGLRERAVRVTCSACGETVFCQRADLYPGVQPCPTSNLRFGFVHPDRCEIVTSGKKTVCPSCGAEVKAKHTSKIRTGTDLFGVFCLTVGRAADRLTLTEWYFDKNVTKDAREVINAYAYEAAVLEDAGMVRMSGYFQFLGGSGWYKQWEQRKRFVDKIGKAGDVFPWDPAILTGSTAENSALDRYLSDCGKEAYPVQYLRLWQKHKNVENLVVQGAARMVDAMIRDEEDTAEYGNQKKSSRIPVLPAVRWKDRRPAQMLGLTKDEFRECVRMNWDPDALRLYTSARNQGIRLALPEDMEVCIEAGADWCLRELTMQGNRRPFLRSARYLRRQRARHPDGKVKLDGRYLGDYWNMAGFLGMDLTDEHLLYPKDLIAAHDRASGRMEEERKNGRSATEKKNWDSRFEALAERLAPLSWENNGILIRCAAAPGELDEEGRALSHCVGGYKDTHAKGEKPIFFIRRAKEPDKPWYTLQLDLIKRTVIQNRGKCNCKETKAVIEFREKWVEHIQNIRLPNEKRKRVRAKVAAA